MRMLTSASRRISLLEILDVRSLVRPYRCGSFIAYLDHNWNKRWSSSVGYSMMDVDNSNGQAADAYRRGHYASGNLLYYPCENVMIGGEFIWGRRENFLDGFKSDDFRIQFSFKYNFSKKWSVSDLETTSGSFVIVKEERESC